MRLREVVVKTIIAIESAVNDGGGSGTGCCGIEVRALTANTSKLTKLAKSRIWT